MKRSDSRFYRPPAVFGSVRYEYYTATLDNWQEGMEAEIVPLAWHVEYEEALRSAEILARLFRLSIVVIDAINGSLIKTSHPKSWPDNRD